MEDRIRGIQERSPSMNSGLHSTKRIKKTENYTNSSAGTDLRGRINMCRVAILERIKNPCCRMDENA